MTNFICSTFELEASYFTGLIAADLAPLMCLSIPFFLNSNEEKDFNEEFSAFLEELHLLRVDGCLYGSNLIGECNLRYLGEFQLFDPATDELIKVIYVKNRFDKSGQSHYDALCLCISVLSERLPATAAKLEALKPRMEEVLLYMPKNNEDELF